MSEIGTACPNCGHQLVAYRTDRQSTARHDVVLHWACCPECRHFSLRRWKVKDPESGEPLEATG